jgi:hypothetical protein
MKQGTPHITVAILLVLCAMAPPGHPGDTGGDRQTETTGLDNPLVWVASEGFSRMQGVNDWSYRFEERPGSLKNLTWNPAGYWEAPAVAAEFRITATDQAAASGHPSVRSWQAPYTGTIRVEGTVTPRMDACPDGLIASIRKGGNVQWERTSGEGTPESHDETMGVTQGDVIGFRIDSDGGSGCAAAAWDPRITYTQGPACWRLVWHDEFNDRDAASPDAAKWRIWDEDKAPCPGCPDLAVSNGEQHDWLADTWQRAENIVVADGVVTIHTRHDGHNRQPFSGGMMDTRGRFEPNGGVAPAVRIEARTLRSGGEAVHPTFWTLGGTDALDAYLYDPAEIDTPAAHGRRQTVGSRELSPTQGGGNWFYEFVDDEDTYQPLEYNARAKRWEKRARGRYLRIGGTYQTPDEGHAVVRAWQAPRSGRVRITFEKIELVRKDCGDGARVSIRVGLGEIEGPADETIVWSHTLRRGGRVGRTSRMVSLRKGDRIRFRVDPQRGGCDRTTWDPTIEYNQWPTRGEIDILEYSPVGTALVGAHTAAFNYTLDNAVIRVIRAGSIDLSAWLVSWVDWYPERLEFYFFESRPGKAAPADPFLVYDHLDGPDEWPFDHGQYLILHDKIKPRNRDGTDRSLPAFPTAFRVDYVRVWERTCDDPATPDR